MKRIIPILFSAIIACAQVNVQKTSGTNAITGNLVVGDGKALTATGTGNIIATAATANSSSGVVVKNSSGTTIATIGAGSSTGIDVGSTATPRSSDPGFNLNRTLTGAANSHGFSDQSEFAKNAGTAYAPFDSRILVSGTASYDHFVSFQAAPTLSTSGTTTNLYGFYSLPGVTDGTVTNAYGVYVANPSLSGSGAITNLWGIYVPAHSGATNNYAAALMGKVGIGTATPAFALDILGTNGRINLADSGTGYSLVKVSNTNGALYVGKENATGGAIINGTAGNGVVVAGDGNNPLYLGTNGTIRITIKGNGVINFASLPTSASGLSSGDLWSNSGVLTVVP